MSELRREAESEAINITSESMPFEWTTYAKEGIDKLRETIADALEAKMRKYKDLYKMTQADALARARLEDKLKAAEERVRSLTEELECYSCGETIKFDELRPECYCNDCENMETVQALKSEKDLSDRLAEALEMSKESLVHYGYDTVNEEEALKLYNERRGK